MAKSSEKNDKAQLEYFERKIFDLKQLIEISKGLNSTLEYNVLIDSILLTCMGQMQLVKAGIFFKKNFDDEYFSLHRNHKGIELNRDTDYVIPNDSYLAGLLAGNDRCFTASEIYADSKVSPAEKDMLSSINPTLLVPLKGKGKFHGIILLGDRIRNCDFSDEEKEYLLDIASLAGIAIENAYLYEVATTDMMTKLKIHHYFQTVLTEEIKLAYQILTPVSLLMLDIDNFKEFNDTYGHLCGDIVLKNVSSLVKKNCRQIDTAARYGGEEIAVILTRTNLDDALNVAERIRDQIASSRITHDGKELKTTVSIGVTEFDRSIKENNNTMIARADSALYDSKRSGKNRVSFCTSGGKTGDINGPR